MNEKSNSPMKLNQGLLKRYDQNFYRRLNDVYIDTVAVVRFLELASKGKHKALVEEIPGNIQVPSHGGRASVKRTQKQLVEIFESAALTGQWEKSLTFAISLTEDLVAGYIKLILRAKPLMLLTSLKGNDGSPTIPLVDVIKSGVEYIVEERVQARVLSAIFATPAEYTKYLAVLLQYQIPPGVINPYIEMKARRDLIIHAGGVVNELYIEKTKGIEGTAKIDDKIIVNRDYFEDSMRNIKKFANSLHKQAVKQYGDDTDIQRVLRLRGI